MSNLVLENLQVTVSNKIVVAGANLELSPCSVHVLMGRNGSGKSSLINAIIKTPGYLVSGGSASIDGCSFAEMSVDQIAHSGLFVSCQYPQEISGLSNGAFIKSMANIRSQKLGFPALGSGAFLKEAKDVCAKLGISEDFLRKNVNSEMSGGERKRNELLQLHFFKPCFALLDEIDSGLDVDAWDLAISFIKAEQKELGFGLLIVTHNSKVVDRFPDCKVHLMTDGGIVKSGGADLAKLVDSIGYEGALK